MFGIDIGADATVALSFGNNVHGEGGLTRRLWAVDLDNATTRQTANAEREVEGQSAGGDRLDPHGALLAHLHDRALTKLLLDLAKRHVECLVAFLRERWAVRFLCHRLLLLGVRPRSARDSYG
ncbi:unannotated protein [freshwater metagenome]|uniref:Unannotated protein n=1 Tax=freshwater metagenome TaxID=449393 RepID=A0A6J7JE99_9ZZZZ